MKGHVGGGPVTDSLWVSADRSNLCRSLMLASTQACLAEEANVLNANTPVCDFVQERLPEMPACFPLFRGELVVHQLESLILAQNERWRHA